VNEDRRTAVVRQEVIRIVAVVMGLSEKNTRNGTS
jgi:hypothetical protein